MIRFVIKRSGMCPDGSVVKVDYLTVDADLPELEKLLKPDHTYEERMLTGCEMRSVGKPGEHT
jgi:hypothetical protein